MSTESTGDDLAADRRQALLDRLSALGECEHDAKWLDYSAAGIRPSDIRSLIEIALMYTPGGDFGDERLIWAPVHAMRALGQLHAAEAIGPLTALFRWQPGSVLARHEHVEVEQTWVLSGSIVDEEGEALEGQYVWRPKGNRHTASSPHGALVLSFFLKPNKFLDGDLAGKKLE